jgi:hypothetical protein
MKDLLLYVADADALAFMRSIFQWAQERAGKLGKAVAELKQQQPKELFEHVLRDRLKQTISPRDFDERPSASGTCC